MTYILQAKHTNSKDWAPLVRAHRAQFVLTAASLFSCGCCAEEIVQERVVVFLRDVLDYSRRDVSLMVGISDVQSDRLLSLARRRVAGETTAFSRTPLESTSAHLHLHIVQQSFTKDLTSNVIK